MDQPGTVYLTGAGPGAADLLTVRAARILARADVVFHDALVSADVLALCSPECKVVAVGKKGGVPSRVRQEHIHRRLLQAAGQHGTVVRLKGGDPCVFGRGGEELEFLAAHGIPWEVIPGISAGVGGLSALGLPLTHRELASSVTLFTGSQALSGTFPGLTTGGLPGGQTLVFYMGFQHVEAIANDLLRQGLPPSTYSLCASRLSWPDQRLLTAPLDRIGAAVASANMQTPALLVVGGVVDFWRSLRPEGPAS